MKMLARILAAALAFSPCLALAQVALPPNVTLSGHVVAGGNAPPTAVGGTLGAGSTDTAGTLTASAASGSLTFASPFAVAPSCMFQDESATPISVYTVSATAITLTTLTSGHIYQYVCVGKIGG